MSSSPVTSLKVICFTLMNNIYWQKCLSIQCHAFPLLPKNFTSSLTTKSLRKNQQKFCFKNLISSRISLGTQQQKKDFLFVTNASQSLSKLQCELPVVTRAVSKFANLECIFWKFKTIFFRFYSKEEGLFRRYWWYEFGIYDFPEFRNVPIYLMINAGIQFEKPITPKSISLSTSQMFPPSLVNGFPIMLYSYLFWNRRYVFAMIVFKIVQPSYEGIDIDELFFIFNKRFLFYSPSPHFFH